MRLFGNVKENFKNNFLQLWNIVVWSDTIWFMKTFYNLQTLDLIKSKRKLSDNKKTTICLPKYEQTNISQFSHIYYADNYNSKNTQINLKCTNWHVERIFDCLIYNKLADSAKVVLPYELFVINYNKITIKESEMR